jgi:hypothetical protein
MRVVISASIIALLTVPAYSQALNLMRDDKPQISEEQKKKNEEIDKAYKSATQQLPDKNASNDPWSGVRGADQKQTKAQTKPVSPRN